MTTTTIDRRHGVVASKAIKVPCRVATTANITLSGLQTIDGIALAAEDRVLVKNQTAGLENGIYEASTGSWVRAVDFDGTQDAVRGTLVKVNEGSSQASFWFLSTANPIVIGTTAITFTIAPTELAVVSAYMQTLLDDADAATARTTLGSTSIGDALFIAASAAAARTTLGATSVGDALFIAASAAAGRSTLSAVGLTGDETIAGGKTFSGLLNVTSGQIQFPAIQAASVGANTLDDYEEGAWTPSVGGSATYNLQAGTYTKIGRLVFVRGGMTINAIGTGSTTVVSGLPFAASDAWVMPIASLTSSATNVVSVAGVGTLGASTFTLVSRVAASASDTTNAIFANSTAVTFSGVYEV